MGLIPRLQTAVEYAAEIKEAEAARKARERMEKKEYVTRLVEAQIAGCVDLSPEEMVDAAFLIVERIDDKLDGKE